MIYQKGFTSWLVSISKGRVGCKEIGNNGGTAVRAFQSATSERPGAWPWCAAFVCWCYQVASLNSEEASRVRPTTALAFGFEEWFRVHGELRHDVGNIRPGDVPIYSFSHIGIAVSSVLDGVVRVVEGNTDATGGRDGDGVYERVRSIKLIRSYGRFKEAS